MITDQLLFAVKRTLSGFTVTMGERTFVVNVNTDNVREVVGGDYVSLNGTDLAEHLKSFVTYNIVALQTRFRDFDLI